MENELTKKRFQVMIRNHNGKLEKCILIDGELLDWSIDLSSFLDATKMGPMFRKEIQRSIVEHFVDSVSDFLSRKVTIDEIQKAIKTGWI